MSTDSHLSPRPAEVPTLYRAASYVAIGWAAILLVRALYNCFAVVGPGQFLLGIVYYGSHGGSGQAETSSFDYAILYAVGGLFILRGSHWARGLVCGVAAVEGYNRLRSLTGALFDPSQRPWFTGQLTGQLLLATLIVGVLVTIALVIMLSRRVGAHVPWQPPPSPWTAAAQAAMYPAQQGAPQYAPQPVPQQQAPQQHYYPQQAPPQAYPQSAAPQQAYQQLPQPQGPQQGQPPQGPTLPPYVAPPTAATPPPTQLSTPQQQPQQPPQQQPRPAEPSDAVPLSDEATTRFRAVPPNPTS
ncbi:hypothetical protein EDD99_4688 [Streptomyces sp. 846.5]|nr:hypothetical protein [Streptomyces sp. 846.5]TDU06142.1 hypothetical protein EDD99_4688 [Streptomyces sp. 846.5]